MKVSFFLVLLCTISAIAIANESLKKCENTCHEKACNRENRLCIK